MWQWHQSSHISLGRKANYLLPKMWSHSYKAVKQMTDNLSSCICLPSWQHITKLVCGSAAFLSSSRSRKGSFGHNVLNAEAPLKTCVFWTCEGASFDVQAVAVVGFSLCRTFSKHSELADTLYTNTAVDTSNNSKNLMFLKQRWFLVRWLICVSPYLTFCLIKQSYAALHLFSVWFITTVSKVLHSVFLISSHYSLWCSFFTLPEN